MGHGGGEGGGQMEREQVAQRRPRSQDLHVPAKSPWGSATAGEVLATIALERAGRGPHMG